VLILAASTQLRSQFIDVSGLAAYNHVVALFLVMLDARGAGNLKNLNSLLIKNFMFGILC
jgi:hypothetical protein